MRCVLTRQRVFSIERHLQTSVVILVQLQCIVDVELVRYVGAVIFEHLKSHLREHNKQTIVYCVTQH